MLYNNGFGLLVLSANLVGIEAVCQGLCILDYLIALYMSRQLLLICLFYLVGAGTALACGTIEGRTARYLATKEANHEARLVELKFLNCPPIVQQYRPTQTNDALLIEVAIDAMTRANELLKADHALATRYGNMAIKLFFNYDRLFTMAGQKDYSLLERAMAQYVGVATKRWRKFVTGYRYDPARKETFNPDTFEAQVASELHEYRRLIQ